MRILVLNGSPAGKDSITLQTVEYGKALFPEHEYTTLHVSRQIRSIEKNFTTAREELMAADLILFAYPVYTFLVPAQLHRFIELIKEYHVDLRGKYATQVSTSKHFYDTTAHRFIADNCADLGLRYIRGLSADMEDLLTRKGQDEARAFFRFLFWNIHCGFEEPVLKQQTDPDLSPDVIPISALTDAPGTDSHSGPAVASCGVKPFRAPRDIRIALVAEFDPQDTDSALRAMIRRFEKRMPGGCEVINLREFPFAGGCLGCFHCADDGKCVYKDGFDSFLREHINDADAVVYAFTIRDHSMGSRFKMYDDRQFCNGHRTVTMGRPVGYLIDGDLGSEENLRTLIEARAEVGGNYLAGIASDQRDPDGEIDQMARRLLYAIVHAYTQPKDFYGVGGLKIFRDLIYEMQGLMREDHRFYRKHGFYDDFPQKKKGRIAAMYLVSALMKARKRRKKTGIDMTEGMLMPYKKVVEKALISHTGV